MVVHQLADVPREVGEDHAVGGQVLGPPLLLLLLPLALDLLVQPEQAGEVVVVLRGVALLLGRAGVRSLTVNLMMMILI